MNSGAPAILAVDVGNTAVKIALVRGRRILRAASLPTRSVRRGMALPASIAAVRPAAAAIASVVPRAVPPLVAAVRRTFGFPPLILRPADCGIPLSLPNPAALGVDRALAAAAARARFGAPVIVCDIGTAVTVDLVAPDGSFAGGAILPGPALWTSSLNAAALVKAPVFAVPRTAAGRTTAAAVRSGAFWGICGAVERIAAEFRRTAGPAPLVLTGGYAAVFARRLDTHPPVVPSLTLEGIAAAASHHGRAPNRRR